MKQMMELRKVRTKSIEEKTNKILVDVVAGNTDIEKVKELQSDIRVLNGQVDLLDLVMGLK
jgi:outer membrane murein-binding lipoprotein Lpp